MFVTIIAVQFTMIHWNTTAHIIILSLDNVILYDFVNCQKQSAHLCQLKMLASVLCYTFREVQHTTFTTDVQYIMTLKNITVPGEIL